MSTHLDTMINNAAEELAQYAFDNRVEYYEGESWLFGNHILEDIEKKFYWHLRDITANTSDKQLI